MKTKMLADFQICISVPLMSYDHGCLVASQKDIYIRLGIQRVETILLVVLYQPFLKVIKKIYSLITKNVK